MVSLTGSVEAGQEILRDAADKVMKTSLELGGKAPAIVFPRRRHRPRRQGASPTPG